MNIALRQDQQETAYLTCLIDMTLEELQAYAEERGISTSGKRKPVLAMELLAAKFD